MGGDIEFIESDFEQGESYQGLGPAYFAARRIVEKSMEAFAAEHFKPMIDKFALDFGDRLWGDVENSLLTDVEINLQSRVSGLVDDTVDALLTGKEWAMERYPYAKYHRGEEIRKAVAAHGSDQLLMARIADLEAQLKKEREDNQWLRAR